MNVASRVNDLFLNHIKTKRISNGISVFRIGFSCFRNHTFHSCIVRCPLDNISLVRLSVLRIPTYCGRMVEQESHACRYAM